MSEWVGYDYAFAVMIFLQISRYQQVFADLFRRGTFFSSGNFHLRHRVVAVDRRKSIAVDQSDQVILCLLM